MGLSLEALISSARDGQRLRVAVAGGDASEALAAVKDAREQGLIDVTLCGDPEGTRRRASEIGYDLAPDHIVPAVDSSEAARLAVGEVASGRAQLLMKGGVPTADLLRAVLDREAGLRKGQLLSHVGVFEVPGTERLIFLTDAGVNIAPTLAQKAQIVQNAVDLAQRMGVPEPKVAALAAVEAVNPDMPATVDAACLSVMSRRGQIRNAIVDGPLALDNAISKSAAGRKGIASPVAGEADILLVPEIETGNVAYKMLLFFGGAKVAGVICGAKVPIITTSRSEGHETKLLSIGLAIYLARQTG